MIDTSRIRIMAKVVFPITVFLLLVITLDSVKADLVNGEISLADASQIYRLTGNWRFSRTDHPEFSQADFDDSQWEWLRVPGQWITMGIKTEGTAWYRCRFVLSSTLQLVPLAIQVPVIIEAHELFVNGVKIGGSGKISSAGIILKRNNKPGIYPIPKQILREQGINVIALRVSDDVGWGGVANNQFNLGPTKQLELNFRKTVLWNLSVLLVLVFLGIFFLILYLYFDREKSFLYFSQLALIISLTLFGYFSYPFWIYDNYWFYFYIFQTGINIAPVFAIRFAYSFSDFYNKRLLKWLTIECSALFLVLLLAPIHIMFLRFFAYVTLNIALATVLFCVIYLMYIVVVNIKQKKAGARIAGFGSMIVMICFINDVFSYLLALNTPRIGLIGTVVFMICNSYALFIKHSRIK